MSIKLSGQPNYQDWLEPEVSKSEVNLWNKKLRIPEARKSQASGGLSTAQVPEKKAFVLLLPTDTQEEWILCTREQADIIKSESAQFRQALRIKELLSFFTTNEDAKVVSFISNHSFLIEILQESLNQIKKIFGENIEELSLELYEDIEEEFECLFVVIKTTLLTKESHDLLEKLEDEWLLDNVSDEAALIFSVTVRSILV
jgi:hypothetical protein